MQSLPRKPGQSKTLRVYLVSAVAGALLIGACLIYLGSGADRDLHFTREVPTQLPIETLDQSIHSISNWPKWFHTLAKAERVNLMDTPLPTVDQEAKTGALVMLNFDPGKGARKRFRLLVQVAEYVPRKSITLRLARDETTKIVRMVEGLEWKIEFKPGPSPGETRIWGTATARTRSWRGRFFGNLSERILMNQLFYPDVMALGLFTQPVGPNPYPVYGQ